MTHQTGSKFVGTQINYTHEEGRRQFTHEDSILFNIIDCINREADHSSKLALGVLCSVVRSGSRTHSWQIRRPYHEHIAALLLVFEL